MTSVERRMIFHNNNDFNDQKYSIIVIDIYL